MTDRINLRVDYEDQVDWLQDSIIIENVIMPQEHNQLIIELEQAVYDTPVLCTNPHLHTSISWVIHLLIPMSP